MMDEYITRNNVISAVCFGCNQEFSDEPCEPDACATRRSVMVLPSADVVPKSECNECAERTRKAIERLQSQINRLKKYDEERDIALHARLIEKTKEKVSSEIFDEFDTVIGDCEAWDHLPAVVLMLLADLKKRYQKRGDKNGL